MSTVEALSCQEVVELVTDYLEGALEPEEHALVQQHLAGCTKCDAYLDQIRTTIRLVGRVDVSSLSAEAQHALVEAFRGFSPRA
ncbi:MAG: zf-HC2 domain-containing protein [Actinomycetota bacterium]|nr:zf-HC2 domain-containing protein [Actinomycetota bacterium]